MRDGEAAAAGLGMRGTFGHFMFVNGAADLVRLGRWDEAQERLEAAERLELRLDHGRAPRGGRRRAVRAPRRDGARPLAARCGDRTRRRRHPEPSSSRPSMARSRHSPPSRATRARRAGRSRRRWRRSARTADPLYRHRCTRSACVRRPTPARSRRAPTSCSRSSKCMPESAAGARERARWRAPSARRLAGASDAAAWNAGDGALGRARRAAPGGYARLAPPRRCSSPAAVADAEELLRSRRAAAAALFSAPTAAGGG